VLEYSKKFEERNNKKTPAVTIVAACSNELTGVGPSMASGNHVCKPNWADLPIAPINKKKQIKSKILTDKLKNITFSCLIKSIKLKTIK